jgi:hypothetical protein
MDKRTPWSRILSVIGLAMMAIGLTTTVAPPLWSKLLSSFYLEAGWSHSALFSARAATADSCMGLLCWLCCSCCLS